MTVKDTGTTKSLTVNVPTAARLYGISRGHAFELARRGELPGAIRLGNRIVVSRSVIERTINGEQATPAATAP